MIALVATLTAILGGLAGWFARDRRYRRHAARLDAAIGQRTGLLGCPAADRRAEAEQWRARNVARVVASAMHHGRRAAAWSSPAPVPASPAP